MAKKNIEKIIEALLFVTDKPLSGQVLAGVIETTPGAIEKSVKKINERLREDGAPFTVKKVAGGYEFLTLPEYALYIKKLYKNRFMTRLSKPALEVLSIVAYKQPILKQEVEQIRGVNSDGVYHTLLERKLIKIVGRKDTPGRPLLYGTTREFLRYLGVNAIEDLPKIEEIQDILERNESVENWDERVEKAKNQAAFEFGEDEGQRAEERLKREKTEAETEENRGESESEGEKTEGGGS